MVQFIRFQLLDSSTGKAVEGVFEDGGGDRG